MPLAILTLVALTSLATLALLPVELVPWFWAGVGGVMVIVAYCVRGDLLTAILIWFVTLVCLHEEFWRERIPLFFAVTIPRLLIVVLVVLWAGMRLLGRFRTVTAWPLSGLMGTMLVYFTLSAAISGFETRSPITVHYRLIGGYAFPLAIFVLMLHAVRHDRHIRRVTIFFAGLGAYLTFTGWCEHFQLWSLVWPRFIGDPTVGIHWGRVRGPFVMSAAMGLALIFCYFNNLILARQTYGPYRWSLYLLNALMMPVVFWTRTRSVWLAMLLSGAVWVAFARRRTSRAVWIALLIGIAVVVGVLNVENFLSSDRTKGGFTDIEPLYVRIGLAMMTWRMFIDSPLVGVGFGHFRDHAPTQATDPASPFYAFASTAMEHNNFLSILAETGLIGLILYLAVLWQLLRMSRTLFARLPAEAPGFINRDLLVLYWVLMMAYLIDSMLRETSDNPFANSLFFGLSGMIAAISFRLGPAPLLEGLEPPPRFGSRTEAGGPASGSGGPASSVEWGLGGFMASSDAVSADVPTHARTDMPASSRSRRASTADERVDADASVSLHGRPVIHLPERPQ
ncbi:MAG: O-antigen ligase family protein [Phycisphaerae bacterium]|nr:O-antigen ligase family protein [Phycisphaerae bacterium]NUQ44860.1 O-antigen ligase family protein [Phycisphaerae bacterium]